jgi:hypothetical protein
MRRPSLARPWLANQHRPRRASGSGSPVRRWPVSRQALPAVPRHLRPGAIAASPRPPSRLPPFLCPPVLGDDGIRAAFDVVVRRCPAGDADPHGRPVLPGGRPAPARSTLLDSGHKIHCLVVGGDYQTVMHGPASLGVPAELRGIRRVPVRASGYRAGTVTRVVPPAVMAKPRRLAAWNGAEAGYQAGGLPAAMVHPPASAS